MLKYYLYWNSDIFSHRNYIINDSNGIKYYRIMKKTIFILILLIGCLGIEGKTTYIPTYYSYIQIKHGEDTVSISGNMI